MLVPILRAYDASNDKSVRSKLMDAIILASGFNQKFLNFRADQIKRKCNINVQRAMESSPSISSDNLFGDDLLDRIKKLNISSKISKSSILMSDTKSTTAKPAKSFKQRNMKNYQGKPAPKFDYNKGPNPYYKPLNDKGSNDRYFFNRRK